MEYQYGMTVSFPEKNYSQDPSNNHGRTILVAPPSIGVVCDITGAITTGAYVDVY